MALTKLCVHPTSSRALVKRGAVPVILQSMQDNPTRKGVLARYIRALTNFVYTEHRTQGALADKNGYAIVANLAQRHPNYQPLQTEMAAFQKAGRLGRRGPFTTQNHDSHVRDKLDITTFRFVSAGTIVKKYGSNGKAKKKILKANDSCDLLLFEDPNGQKAPKQLNMKSINGVVKGAQAAGMEKCNPDNAWVIISTDPNGREYRLGLECKTNLETEKWINGLQSLYTFER